MANCKPGDLAVIIRGIHTQANVGRLVNIVQLATDEWRRANNYTPPEHSGVSWVVVPLDRTPLVVPHTDSRTGVQFVRRSDTLEALIYDGNLRPIRPPAPEQDTPTSVSISPKVQAVDELLARVLPKEAQHENV